MKNEIVIEHFQWAVFSPINVMFESTLSYSRAASIKAFMRGQNETWAYRKKKGFYTARVTMSWVGRKIEETEKGKESGE